MDALDPQMVLAVLSFLAPADLARMSCTSSQLAALAMDESLFEPIARKKFGFDGDAPREGCWRYETLLLKRRKDYQRRLTLGMLGRVASHPPAMKPHRYISAATATGGAAAPTVGGAASAAAPVLLGEDEAYDRRVAVRQGSCTWSSLRSSGSSSAEEATAAASAAVPATSISPVVGAAAIPGGTTAAAGGDAAAASAVIVASVVAAAAAADTASTRTAACVG